MGGAAYFCPDEADGGGWAGLGENGQGYAVTGPFRYFDFHGRLC